MSRIPRVRAAAAAIVAAFVAVLGLAITPASAAVSAVALASGGEPTVLANSTGQAAADISATITGTTQAGDELLIRVDDNDGGANCGATGDTIGFSSLPTVSITTTVAGTLASISPSIRSAGSCTVVNNELRIVLGASTAASQVVTISGIKYDIGNAVAQGPVRVTASGVASDGPVSNATVRTLEVTANSPATAIEKDAGSTAISNVVVKELATGALSGDFCLTITAPTGAAFDQTSTPTVTGAASGEGITPTISANQVTVDFTGANASTASTYTVGNLKITPGSGTGLVKGTLNDCGGNDLFDAVTLTAIVDSTRLQGSDRFATARAIAADLGTNDNVIVARADLPFDSLAASYLSGKLGFAPILLVNTNGPVPADTLSAISQAQATTVYIVGGPQAVSQAVQDQLAGVTSSKPAANGAKLTVRRIQGQDRYETARRVATDAATAGGGGAGQLNGKKTAILATGENFADALVGGPISSRAAFPVLLTNSNSLNANASAAMTDLGITHVLILGGPVAVSTTVENAVPATTTKTRLFGADRQATSVEIAKFARRATSGSTLGLGWAALANGDLIHLARGDNFADSLTGGPEAGQEQSPIVLTAGPSSLGTAASDYLKSLAGLVSRLHVFGGPDAVQAAVVTAAQNALTGA